MNRIETGEWKKFRIGDIFDISRPTKRVQLEYEDGSIPFVSSGNYNNGVLKMVTPKENEPLDRGNCLTVSPIDASTFYQKEDFLGRGGAGSAILILRNVHLTEASGLFISTIIKYSLTRVKYNDQLNNASIRKAIIRLPVTSSGEPDWDDMGNYMEQILTRSDERLGTLSSVITNKSL